jgi:uncharacterized membrane protein
MLLRPSIIGNHRLHGSDLSKKGKRVESIDLLRGIVMIIMAIDHVRDYFHKEAFIYSPTDLEQTNVPLFFTRWITHFCAPVFILLAGISAYLYGNKKGIKELSFFLWTRGLWLIFVELFILSLFRTFNPTFHYFNLQVIWVIGLSMIILSAIIRLSLGWLLSIGFLLVGAHNLLDSVHFPSHNFLSFLWSLLHNMDRFTFGGFDFFVHYPLLPWLGVMILGYSIGSLYAPAFDATRRKRILLIVGLSSIVLFVLLRVGSFYGDPSPWKIQRSPAFSFMSFINVTKYPPSLLYVLVTLGPACLFLALTERPLNKWTARISIFGRVAMFYYLAHILLIHLGAVIGALIQGYSASDMVLSTSVDASPQLKGFGFSLPAVYLVWTTLILLLYPLCKWFDKYKRANVQRYRWLSYL